MAPLLNDPSRPLRIVLCNSARRWIGEAAHTVALAEGLRARGHTVLLGLRRGFEVEAVARDRGLPAVSFAFNSRFHLLSDPADLVRLARAAQSIQADLVHCNRGKDHWLAAALRVLAPPFARPIVRSRHVVVPVRHHALNTWLYRSATSGILSVSLAAQASLGDYAPDPAARGARPIGGVIYSAVDATRFRPDLRSETVRRDLGAGPGDLLVGLVARIQRIKGQRFFLEAAARVARDFPRARFVLAGRGHPNLVRNLRQTAQALGLPEDHLTILGVLPDLPQVMASFDIGVVASIGSEGSSRVSLEYMASGLPIVATRVGGIPELVEDGVHGLLVPPADSDALAQAVLSLVQDTDRRTRLGTAGRLTAETRYHPDRWLGEIEAFYRRVLAH